VKVDIDRLRSVLARSPWVEESAFLPHERAYAEGSDDPPHHLALTLAAKQSALKALGLGPAAEWVPRVSIVRDRYGAFSARVDGHDHLPIAVAACHLEGFALGMASTGTPVPEGEDPFLADEWRPIV
jgi:phosphopantetheinyl transferase (holo-ACP synthase)